MQAPPPGARFRFVQFEFAFQLGPADGRYLTREDPDADPERVIVLRTSGAPPRPLIGRRRARRAEGDQPTPVPIVRATVIDTEPLDSADAAGEWLDAMRGDGDGQRSLAAEAARELSRLLRAHRAAAADHAVRDVAPAAANVVRIGYGSGDQVAEGSFADAYDLPPEDERSQVRRRAAALAPDERLAAILGGRERVLAGEELVLRARADIDTGHHREAALQARIALEALLAELDAEEAGELSADRDAVGRAANEALAGVPDPELREAVAASVERMEAAVRRRRLRGQVTSA